MHIEKNVCVALMKTLSSAKGSKSDGHSVREDLRAENRMPALHTPVSVTTDARTGAKNYKYRKAPWVWTPSEFKVVTETIAAIKAPSNYGSSMAHKFKDKKVLGMKTHDWHNVLHNYLAVAIRGTLTADVRSAVYKVSNFFKNVCAREFRVDDLPQLELEGYEAACLLEMTMPPSFFDIQPHLMIHLVRDIYHAGPVQYRWMYFVERYMKKLKDWVRQHARPESSMAEGYITFEAMVMATEYASLLDPTAPPMWRVGETREMAKQVLPRAFVLKKLSEVVYEQAHSFVLKNHHTLEDWRQRHAALTEHPGSTIESFRHWLRPAVLLALEAGEVISQDVLDLSAGPSEKGRHYSAMWSRGRHFRIGRRDHASKTTSDSYISAYFEMGRAGRLEFVGQIDSIIMLDYDTVKQTLIRGNWWQNNQTERRKSTTLVMDECGVNRVLAREFLNSHLQRHEPFIYPEDCNQVFLVDDRLHRQWKLVVDAEARRRRVFEINVPEVAATYGDGGVAVEDDDNEAVQIEDPASSDDERVLEDNLDELHENIPLVYRRRRRVLEDHVLDLEQEEEIRLDDVEVAGNSKDDGEYAGIVEVDESDNNSDYETLEL